LCVVTALTASSVTDAATNDHYSCPLAVITAELPTPASIPATPPAAVAGQVSMPNS
jgi:hypothetical protein